MSEPHWSNKINSGEDKTTFADELNKKHFEYTLSEHLAKTPYVMTRGQVKRVDGKGVMVQVPLVLIKRMETACIGATSPTLMALAEWALNQLEESNQTLTIDNRSK